MSEHTTNNRPGYDGGCYWCGRAAYALAALSEVYHRPPQPGDGPVPLCPQHLEEMEQARIPGEEEYPPDGAPHTEQLQRQVQDLRRRLEELQRQVEALAEVVWRLEGR